MTVSVGGQTGQIELTHPITKGDDGGYYIPSIDEAGNLTWAGSEDGMEVVEGSNIRGPKGETGAAGKDGVDGNSGVYLGTAEPDDSYNVWISPDGEAATVVTYEQMVEYVDEAQPDLSEYAKTTEIPDVSGFVNAEYVQTAIDESLPDLSEYAKTADIPDVSSFATTEYVDAAIPSLEGYAKTEDIPSLDGYATETYVDEAIVNIDIPDVDLTNYYTKEQVDALIAAGGGGTGVVWEYPTQIQNDLRLFQGLTIIQSNNSLEVY